MCIFPRFGFLNLFVCTNKAVRKEYSAAAAAYMQSCTILVFVYGAAVCVWIKLNDEHICTYYTFSILPTSYKKSA